MNAPRYDALVFLGATGDLAFKMILPALQTMAGRGHLDIPVIGEAKAGWDLDRFKQRGGERIQDSSFEIRRLSRHPEMSA